MAGELIRANKEMDGFKKPRTMDEILEDKLAPVIEAVNQNVEKIYQDFNMALTKQLQNIDHVERGISHMVQVLWGTVNQANARTAALERVLLKNGLSQEDLEAEILLVQKELEATGEWKELGVADIAQKMGVDIPGGEPPAPRSPGPPQSV